MTSLLILHSQQWPIYTVHKHCVYCQLKSKTVFDEHWTQKHTFLFCILNIIEGDWLWIHKTEWPAFLFSTANKGPCILSKNKTDDGYRKIFSNRKNLALFHLSLKLSSVYCQLQIENCFWLTLIDIDTAIVNSWLIFARQHRDIYIYMVVKYKYK